MSEKTIEIVNITSTFDPKTGNVLLFGIDQNSLVYKYSYDFGGWLPNTKAFDESQIAKLKQAQAPAGRTERRLAKKAANRK